MAGFVVKIEYGGVLRDINIDGVGDHEFKVSYIQNRARELFKLPAHTVVEFTYIDGDGDVVALTDDHDVVDGLFLQGLNPLRIFMVTKTPVPAPNGLIPIRGSNSMSSSSFGTADSVAVNAAADTIHQLPSTIEVVTNSVGTLSISRESPIGLQKIDAIITDESETWESRKAKFADVPPENLTPSTRLHIEEVEDSNSVLFSSFSLKSNRKLRRLERRVCCCPSPSTRLHVEAVEDPNSILLNNFSFLCNRKLRSNQISHLSQSGTPTNVLSLEPLR